MMVLMYRLGRLNLDGHFLISDRRNDEFSGALYEDQGFLQSLYKSLSVDGILTSQGGDAPSIRSTAYGIASKNRSNFLESLLKLGFESIRSYEEVCSASIVRGHPSMSNDSVECGIDKVPLFCVVTDFVTGALWI